ncbi:MAG: hypothetical protein LBI05_06405 [Planctomycetaceae bacterium]|jgi:hypothetical protein|nr:hypothetical protein [Planctomycetaceae bacterium]
MKKVLFACALMLCPMLAWAQEEVSEDSVIDLSDPVFEQFVSIELLGDAWSSQDASLLTDVAILFQKAEKELFRSHRAFTAQQLMDKALVLAADSKDTATLERLEKIAKANGNNAFATKVASTTKLSAESRNIVPSIDLLTTKMKPESLFYYTSFADLIKRCRLIGDAQTLEKLEKSLPSVQEVKEKMDKEMVDSLIKLSAESRAAIGKVSEEEQAVGVALEMLADESRGPGGPGGGWGPKPPYPGHGKPKPPYGPWGPQSPGPWGPKPPYGGGYGGHHGGGWHHKPLTPEERLAHDIGRLIGTLISQ